MNEDCTDFKARVSSPCGTVGYSYSGPSSDNFSEGEWNVC